MTTPLMDDALYGINYKSKRRCAVCNQSQWIDISATGYVMCLACGNKEPIED